MERWTYAPVANSLKWMELPRPLRRTRLICYYQHSIVYFNMTKILREEGMNL